MKRILLSFLLVCCLPAYGKKEFGHSFIGIGGGYRYNRADLNGQSYKGMSFVPQLLGGYGWLKGQSYYGIEGTLGYDSFSKKKGPSKLEKSWMVEGSFRMGKVIRSYFLPFIRIGAGYHSYCLRLSGKKSSFGAQMMFLGLGVDAFIDEDVSIRSEFLHGRTLGFSRLKTNADKKPFHSTLMLSLSYHFS